MYNPKKYTVTPYDTRWDIRNTRTTRGRNRQQNITTPGCRTRIGYHHKCMYDYNSMYAWSGDVAHFCAETTRYYRVRTIEATKVCYHSSTIIHLYPPPTFIYTPVHPTVSCVSSCAHLHVFYIVLYLQWGIIRIVQHEKMITILQW